MDKLYKKFITDTIEWMKLKETSSVVSPGNYCETRDSFTCRLKKNFSNLKKPLHDEDEYLLAAVAGEIGNNSYDHNLGNWKDITGIVFVYDLENKTVILADRGQGIKETLLKINPSIKTDEEAVRIAFTENISGRYPEKRGNGLKFVSKIVREKKWYLFLRSGYGSAEISNGGINFKTEQDYIYGCLAVVEY